MNINGTSSSNADYSRITGLATGMDTDGMVKQAVAGDQAKIDQAKQAQQVLEWQQEAYVEIIKELKEFQNSFLDILGPSDTNMMKSTSYIGMIAESGTTSKLNATVLSSAIKGDYQVKVERLAEGAKAINQIPDKIVSGTINFTQVKDWVGKTITFSVNGKEETVTISEFTAEDGYDLRAVATKIQNEINGKAALNDKIILNLTDDGKFEFSATDNADITIKDTNIKNLSSLKGESLNVNASTKISSLGITSGNLNITVGGKTFEINVSDTNISLGDFINNLKNAKSNDAVDANKVYLSNFVDINFSGITKKFSMTTKATGGSTTLRVEGTTAIALGIEENYTGVNSIIHIAAPGETEFKTFERSSNSISIDNIKFDMLKTTDGWNTPAVDDDEVINITVKADASSQVDKFKKFIEKYNALIEKINSKITEKKNLNYKPLTDTQKEEMKEDEIKKWEEQAKKGLLARENNLSNLLVQVRQVFYSSVQGVGLNITDIGIGTTSNWRDAGKLEILDEAKLKNALETRGDQVQKLFTQSSNNKDEKGILQRIKDIFNTNIGSEGLLIKKAGYINSRYVVENDLSKNIEKKKQAIKDMQSRMYAKQERYYQMFAALERNMNNLNSQSNWLASQLGAV